MTQGFADTPRNTCGTKTGKMPSKDTFLLRSSKAQKEKVLENQGLFTGGSDLTRTDDTPGMNRML